MPGNMKRHLTNLMHVLAGGCRWWLPAEQNSSFLGPRGLRLEEWIRSGQARVVKEGPHRIVYRVELPEIVFYLKHNLLPDLRTWLRQLVRPSKARMEYHRALDVASRGLPTVVPLALGEKNAFLGIGESYLITQSLENTQPLHIYLLGAAKKLDDCQKTQARQNLAGELGRLLGRIHQAGILHNDLHQGNILLRDNGAGDFSLFLIDLNAVRLGSPLDWSTSLENLAMLNRSFIFRSSRTDRLRFWREYYRVRQELGWSETPPDPGNCKRLSREVEKHTLDSIQGFCQRFERRCLKTNRYFREVAGPGTQGHVVVDLDRADWQRLLDDPDEPFGRPDARFLKNSRSSTVIEMDVRLDGQVRRVIYKRFRVTGWTDPLAALVRPSPAQRSWVFANALLIRSLPTPRPLLLVHRKRLGMNYEGYLMTEKVEGAQDLHQFLEALPQVPAEEARRTLRTRIDQVARVMRELHRCRIANRDPKASNWLLGPLVENDGLQRNFAGVWIIDLVGITHQQRLTRKKRIKNLARLNASFLQSPNLTRADRLRFLRMYLQWNLVGKEGWKYWWKAIEGATQTKVARNIRHKRVLK
jgi:hypothetical protein